MVPPFPRDALPTPALVLDRAALDRNIARMAEYAATHGIALRPHAKTHKSADIARRQLAAGAVGLCCAKLGEAEALAEQGIADTPPDLAGGARRWHMPAYRAQSARMSSKAIRWSRSGR